MNDIGDNKRIITLVLTVWNLEWNQFGFNLIIECEALKIAVIEATVYFSITLVLRNLISKLIQFR